MNDTLANIAVYLLLAVILGAGAIGTFEGWRDDRAQRREDEAHRQDNDSGADPD